MNMKTRAIKLYQTRMSWRISWVIACLLLSLSISFRHNLFFSYYYMIVVGILSLLWSLYLFAVIDEDSITLYMRTLKAKRISIKWSIIRKIAYVKVKKKFKTKNMGIDTGLFAPMNLEDNEGLLIELQEPIAEESQLQRNKQLSEKYSFQVESNRMIFIDSCPEGGFLKLFLSLKQIGGDKVVNNEIFSGKSIKNYRLYTDLCIFIFTIFLLVIKIYHET